MKNFSKIALCALFIGTSVFTSCNDDEAKDETPDPASLYARLGGNTKVQDPRNPGQIIEQGRLSYRSVVDSTITYIVGDILANEPGNLASNFSPLVAEASTPATFETSRAKLSKSLTDFFSAATGGQKTNTYTGLDMVSAHKNGTGGNPRMGSLINNTQYDKFVGYVGAAAIANNVPSSSPIYTDVVAVLQSLRGQIVQAQ